MMRPFVLGLFVVFSLAACTLQSGNDKFARRGRESWSVDGRTYEVAETYYKWVGNSARFVMVTKAGSEMLAPDEAKTLALPLIRYARDRRMHERTAVGPLRGREPPMVGFAVVFVWGEAGKVVGEFDVPGGEVTWRLAHPNDP
jgi:hypothetical protein